MWRRWAKGRQVQEGEDDLHSRAAGEARGGVRAAAVHGGAGETVPGTRAAADGGAGRQHTATVITLQRQVSNR